MRTRTFTYRLAIVMATLLVSAAMHVASAGPQVKRVGNLYQWVDQTGRVIYGDSPPTVTQSRRVSGRGAEGVQREFPGAQTSAGEVDGTTRPVAKRQSGSRLNAAQLAALARLRPDLAEALEQTDTATVEREHSQPARPDDAPGRTQGVVATIAQPPNGGPSDSGDNSSVPRVRLVEAPSPSKPLPAVRAARVEPERVEAPLPAVASGPSTVNLGMTTTSVVEVAHAKPQLIETELSDKERVRMRRRSQAIGERRFLERLKGFQAEPSN